MSTRAPRIGDKVDLINWCIGEVVGLGSETISVKASGDGQVYHQLRSYEGKSWKLMKAPKSFGTKTGVKNMQKKAFTGMVLQHMPVAGIPDTVADIETTLVVPPEIILATSQESAEAYLLRKVPATVNVEYIEVLAREF